MLRNTASTPLRPLAPAGPVPPSPSPPVRSALRPLAPAGPVPLSASPLDHPHRTPLGPIDGNVLLTPVAARKRSISQTRTSAEEDLHSSQRRRVLPVEAPRERPQFFRRGINPSHSPRHQAASKAQNNIKRRHRLQRRGGVSPSLTPSLTRCLPATTASPDQPPEYPEYPPATGSYRYSQVAQSQVAHSQVAHFAPSVQSPASPLTQFTASPLSPPALPAEAELQEQPITETSSHSTASEQPAPTDRPVSPENRNTEHRDLRLPHDAPAIKEEHHRLICKNTRKLDSINQEFCHRCQRRWFNLSLQRSVCRLCRRRDRKKPADKPYLFSKENNLDFGDVPDHLPKLSQVEEMLISRVHVYVCVYQYRGQQFRYRGHVAHFLRDVGSVYKQLPLCPEDLDVVVVRPAQDADQPHKMRQFDGDFRVRRRHVLTWLEFLRENHPGYRDIDIDHVRLSQLPNDGNVESQLPTQRRQNLNLDCTSYVDDHALPVEGDVDGSTIVNLISDKDAIDQLRHRLEHGPNADPGVPLRDVNSADRPHVRMPEISSTPLSEFNRSVALLSLAFPTLFPRGEAEFVDRRQRSVSYKDYIDLALKWWDGRFARHPRFRYVAFNTLVRQRANQRSKFFVRLPHNQHRQDLTLGDLREAISNDTPESRALLSSVVHYWAGVQGTRAYWSARKKELQAMVRALGCPAAFMTFSPADNHWFSLHRHMPRFDEWLAAPAQEKLRIATQTLRENPLIAAAHFRIRFEVFLKTVLCPAMGITDFWVRYEWQARGSPHVHGLFWMRDSPEEPSTAEFQEKFEDYWSQHVSAVNHGRTDTPAETNPLSEPIGECPSTIGRLATIVNRVQTHVCTSTYCQRRRRLPEGGLSAEPSCRFYFPRPQHDRGQMLHHQGRTYDIFDGPRNDPTLNNYSALIAIGWAANHDITPCADMQSVVSYVAKYASKAETSSQSYRDLAASILENASDDLPIHAFVTRFMNKLTGERDWSAMEVCHHLLHEPLIHCSRSFVDVDCRPLSEQRSTSIVDASGVADSPSVYKKYIGRPVGYSDLTYFEFLTTINYSSRDWNKRDVDRVLRYFPKYSSDVNGDSFEDYCRVRLMLHHPHRAVDDLKCVGGDSFDTFSGAYARCVESHVGNRGHPDDYYSPLPPPNPDNFEARDVGDDHIHQEGWQEISVQRPCEQPATTTVTKLGNRDIDHAFDWPGQIGRHREITTEGRPILKRYKAEYMATLDALPSAVDLSRLNQEQRVVVDMFTNHLRHILAGRNPDALRVHVDGPGGTGKSFLIDALSSELQRLSPDRTVYVRAAPTGVAANNIDGTTLHALLRLPMRVFKSSDVNVLVGAELTNLQNRLRGVIYIIIDEKSMIGLTTLACIDQRLRQAFPADQDKVFGGRSLLFLGDFYQLPPVMGKPLYTQGGLSSTLENAGRNAYRSIDKTVELTRVVRQDGSDQAGFRTALAGLRCNRPTTQDWDLLSTRVRRELPPDEIRQFDDAVRIYPTNALVDEYNASHLEQLNSPCVNVDATNQGQNAAKADFFAAGNLYQSLPIAFGAQVMLLENLWTETGLVNGAVGIVEDIAWSETVTNPRKESPAVVMIRFNSYSGPSFFDDADMANVVPIFRSERKFMYRNRFCSRTQFPLTIAYAVTAHKSQGCTLDRAVMDLSHRDFCPGLTYVMVSRVKTLQGLMFECRFDLDQIQTTSESASTSNPRHADRDRRQSEIVHHAPSFF